MVGVGVISKMREILVIGVGEVYKFQIPVEGVGDVHKIPTNPCGGCGEVRQTRTKYL